MPMYIVPGQLRYLLKCHIIRSLYFDQKSSVQKYQKANAFRAGTYVVIKNIGMRGEESNIVAIWQGSSHHVTPRCRANSSGYIADKHSSAAAAGEGLFFSLRFASSSNAPAAKGSLYGGILTYIVIPRDMTRVWCAGRSIYTRLLELRRGIRAGGGFLPSYIAQAAIAVDEFRIYRLPSTILQSTSFAFRDGSSLFSCFFVVTGSLASDLYCTSHSLSIAASCWYRGVI